MHAVVNSLLECSICLQVFQDPRILSCGHTFCLQCIQNTNNRLCSLCKSEWSLPTIGLKGLPKNYIAESFVTSLSAVSRCALTENTVHGAVEFFCVDCWEPLCKECAHGHTRFVSSTKHHVMKKMFDIDQSDIERHNQQKDLLCNQHKKETINFYCTTCEEFGCHTCYILSHNKHECIDVEKADASNKEQLEELVNKVYYKVQQQEATIKDMLLAKTTLESDQQTVIKTINMVVSDVKQKMKNEYDKIIQKIDECLSNALQSVNDKVQAEKEKIEKITENFKLQLQSLQESMSSLKRHIQPLSSAIERWKLLKDKTITEKVNVTINNDCSVSQLTGVHKWKSQINNLLQSYEQALSSVNTIPLLSDEDIMVVSPNRLIIFC